MNDLISRQAAIKAIEDLQDCFNGFSDTYDKACIIGVIEEVPRVDVPDRKVGKWIKNESRYGWHCSACEEDDLYAFAWNSDTGENELQDRYCPNCGADMKGEEDERTD